LSLNGTEPRITPLLCNCDNTYEKLKFKFDFPKPLILFTFLLSFHNIYPIVRFTGRQEPIVNGENKMTALLITLGVSLVLFVASLIAGVIQGSDTRRYYQIMVSQGLSDHEQPINACFGRAARRPTRILGTFIL